MADEGEADLARLRPIIQLTARKTERDRGHWALMRLSRNAECKEPADSNAHVNELGLRGDLVLISVVSIALVSAMGRKRTLREWQEWVESGRGPPPPHAIFHLRSGREARSFCREHHGWESRHDRGARTAALKLF
jgi:hypothetical protein